MGQQFRAIWPVMVVIRIDDDTGMNQDTAHCMTFALSGFVAGRQMWEWEYCRRLDSGHKCRSVDIVPSNCRHSYGPTECIPGNGVPSRGHLSLAPRRLRVISSCSSLVNVYLLWCTATKENKCILDPRSTYTTSSFLKVTSLFSQMNRQSPFPLSGWRL